MKALAKALLAVGAIFGMAAALRRFRRFADPDPSVYGHPHIPRPPGP
ncbi:MAG TPA: hypothetical protein VF157_10130 [Chloroflexota bacterium]